MTTTDQRKPKHFIFMGPPAINVGIMIKQEKNKKGIQMHCSDKPLEITEDQSSENRIYVFDKDLILPADLTSVVLQFDHDPRQAIKEQSSIALDLFLGRSFPPLRCPFPKEASYVFLFQREDMGESKVNLNLSAARQFIYFVHYIYLTFEADELNKAMYDLALHYEIHESKLYIIDGWDAGEFKYIEAIMMMPDNIINALIILGALFTRALSGEFYDAFYKMIGKILPNATNSLGLLGKIKLEPFVKDMACRGLAILIHALVPEDNNQLKCWFKISKDQHLFLQVLKSYYTTVTASMVKITEETYKILEQNIEEAITEPTLKSDCSKQLILFSPTLTFFTKKLVALYGKQAPETKDQLKKLGADMKDGIDEFTEHCVLTYKDINEFIDLYQRELKDRFKTAFKDNQKFKSRIKGEFVPNNKKISENDVIPIIEIQNRNCREITDFSKESLEKFLQPFIGQNNEKFAEFISMIAATLNSETMTNLLKERIDKQYNEAEKEEIMGKLSKEITCLYKVLDPKVSKIIDFYLKDALKYFKRRFNDHAVMIYLCANLEGFPTKEYVEACYKFVFEAIKAEELEIGRLHTIPIVGLKLVELPNSIGLVEIFKEMCKYFDNTKANAYNPQNLFLMFIDEIDAFLLHATTYRALLPNTIEAVFAFYKCMIDKSITVDTTEKLRKNDRAKIVKILNSLLAVKGEEMTDGLSIESMLKDLFERLAAIQGTKRNFKRFSSEKGVLLEKERAILTDILGGFYDKIGNKTMKQMTEDMPKELSVLVEPLADYYFLNDILSMQCLLAQEIGKDIELAAFPKRFAEARETSKKQLTQFIDHVEDQTFGLYEQFFGNRNVKDEVSKILVIMPEKTEALTHIIQIAEYNLEKTAVLNTVNDVLQLKEIIEIHDFDKFYSAFENYSAKVNRVSISESRGLTKDIETKISEAFGVHEKFLKVTLSDLAQGKILLLYIKEKSRETLEKYKQNVNNYGDPLLQRSNFEIMLQLKDYIEKANEQLNYQGFTEFTAKFFKEDALGVEFLLRDSKRYIDKLELFSKNEEGRSILHMEKIGLILAKSEFTLTLKDETWLIDIAYYQKGERQSGQFTYEDLQELRERAIHARNIERQKKENINKEVKKEQKEEETKEELKENKTEEVKEGPIVPKAGKTSPKAQSPKADSASKKDIPPKKDPPAKAETSPKKLEQQKGDSGKKSVVLPKVPVNKKGEVKKENVGEPIEEGKEEVAKEEEKDNEEDREKECAIFLELTELLKNIMNTLNYITDLSYPELKKQYTLFIENFDLSAIRKLWDEDLKKKKSEWESILIQGYRQLSALTFLVPSQFWPVENYLTNPLAVKNAPVNLLRISEIRKDSTFHPSHYEKPKGLQERVMHLGHCIIKMVGEVIDPPLAKSRNIIYAIQGVNLTEGIFHIYTKFDSPLPKPSQLLFCHESTRMEQVISFAYRALGNQHRMFTIVNVEKLTYEIQKKLVDIIQAETGDQEKVPISFIVKDAESLVIKHFKARNSVELVKKTVWKDSDIKEKLKKEAKEYFESVSIFVSPRAGVGKTCYIQKEAKTNKLTLFYVSLFGELSIRQIIKKLEQVIQSMPPSGFALYFKLFQVINPQVLDELFFQILIMRCVQYDESFVFLPENCKIYVEIANTHNEILAKNFAFKRYFTCKNLGTLNVYECIDLERTIFKHVINYISLLEKPEINTTDISIKALKPVDVNESIDLMEKYLFSAEGIGRVPLVQVSIFLKFLSKMLENYERSGLFKLGKDEKKSAINRKAIVGELIKSSIKLTENSIQSRESIESIQSAVDSVDGDQSEANNSYANNLLKVIVPFKDRKMMFICFTEVGHIVPLYESISVMPPDIKTLLKAIPKPPKKKGEEEPIDILSVDYKKMKHEDFARFLRHIFKLPKLDTEDYVITFDNFYKMIYIYLRAISEIPIVLMGETGCGKTRIIRFLCQKVMNAELNIMNVHAGITSDDIIKFTNDIVTKASKDETKKHWVFFDEFNTNENLGLISEIICDRVLEGQPLPNNIMFMAACNPYKKTTKGNAVGDAAGLNKDIMISSQNKALLYKVFQLPQTIIEYVWDFGPLKAEDEGTYISAIIGSGEFPKEWKEKVIRMIQIAHGFFREEDEQHIISLRDIRRFLSLYKWFTANSKDCEKASVLALVFCYYYRISNETARTRLLCKISSCLYGDNTGQKIRDIINDEANYYTSKITLKNDIVWNDSLRECLFVMIVSVLTRTPLLAIGKPGCSKTLSLQILEEHFKGDNSRDSFFKKFKEVVLFTIQGSLHCNSKEIDTLFERARNSLKTRNTLPVVVIEEIGLCELSPYNPLKVLHKTLEMESLEVGFIGLSNWRLDAAKMNRALYLNRLPPSNLELEKTADEIFKKFVPNKEEPLMKVIAQAYQSFQQQFDTEASSDVFGLRDYYAMLKHVAKGLNGNLKVEETYRVIGTAIKRNFSKIPSEHRITSMWKQFCNKDESVAHYAQKVSKIDIIHDSLVNNRDRYILLTGNYHSITLVTQIFFKSAVEKMNIVVGSEYENDINNDEYTNNMLSKIIYFVERGIPLVIKNLKKINSNLYDLYNQHYGADYCRIKAGANFTPVCKMHSNFHCLILMGFEDFKKEQPPLLNRLEKYYLSLDKLLDDNAKGIYGQLSSWLKELIKSQGQDSSLTLQHLFANLDLKEDLLRILILSRTHGREYNKAKVKKEVKNCLIQLATVDLSIFISMSKRSEERKEKLIKRYNDLHKLSLKDELDLLAKEQTGQRMLYFTYSEKKDDQKKLQTDYKELVLVIVLGEIKSEENLNTEVLNFFANPKMNLMLIAIDSTTELKHIDHLQATILKFQEVNMKKNVCLLMYLKRNQSFENRQMIYLDGYTMKMKDSFEENLDNMLPQLKSQITVAITDEMKKSFNECFPTWLNEAFVKIKTNWTDAREALANGHEEDSIKLIKNVSQSKELVELIKTKVDEVIKVMDEKDEDLRKSVCGPEGLKYQTIPQAAKKIVTDKIQNNICIVIYTIERYSALKSYFTLDNSGDENDIKKIWMKEFKKLNFDWNIKLIEGSNRMYVPDLEFPFSMRMYEMIEKTLMKDTNRSGYKMKNEDYIYNIIDECIYGTDRRDTLISMILEDFLKIIARKHRIMIKDDTIKYFSKLMTSDENSMLPVIGQYVCLFFEKQRVLRSILNLLRLCGELYFPLEELAQSDLESSFIYSEEVKEPINQVEALLRKLREKGGIVIMKLIDNLVPSEKLFRFLKEKKMQYLEVLIQLFIFTHSIVEDVRKLRNWHNFLFWLELARYVAAVRESDDVILEVAKKMNGIRETAKSIGAAMQTDEFIQFMLEYIRPKEEQLLKEAAIPKVIPKEDETHGSQVPKDNSNKLNSLALQKLKVAVYRLTIFGSNTKYLPILLDEFNNEANLKCYMRILTDVCNQTRLLEFFNLPLSSQIKLPVNMHMKEIEKYLAKNGVTCEFGVLLFYYLQKHTKVTQAFKIINKDNVAQFIADCFVTADVENNLARAECPCLLTLISCLYLRNCTESFLTNTSTYSKKLLTTACYFSTNPIAATLRLFILKRVKERTESYNSLKSTFSKYINLVSSDSGNSLLFIPTDPIQKERYYKLASTMRYLKTVTFKYDDKTFKKWLSTISKESQEGFNFLLPLTLTFLNELYMVHFKVAEDVRESLAKALMEEHKKVFTTSVGPYLYDFFIALNMNFLSECKLLSMKPDPASVKNNFTLFSVCYVISIFLSAKDIVNPFTSCFYKNQVLNEEVKDLISSSYLFGRKDSNPKIKEKGYSEHISESFVADEGSRCINSITHRVMHFILHSILYYLNYKQLIKGLIKENENESFEDYLISHINTDISILTQLVDLSGCGNIAIVTYWLPQVLGEFCRLLPTMQINKTAATDKERDDFENMFQKAIIDPMTRKIEETSQNYKDQISEFRNSKYYVDPKQLLDEEKEDANYMNIEFFSTLAHPTTEGLMKYINESKEQYPIAFVLTMHEEAKVAKAQHLPPIVSLTNYFLEDYSYKVTREGAKLEVVNFQKNEQLGGLMKEFTQAWETAKFGKEIVYESNVESNDIKFEGSSSISDFLIDPKQHAGKVLIGAMKKLADIHNEVTKSFMIQASIVFNPEFGTAVVNGSPKKKEEISPMFDQRIYPIQSVTKGDMVTFLGYDILARNFYYYTAKRQNKTIYYDLDAIESWLMSQLMDKKLLDVKNIDAICYQDDFADKVDLHEKLENKNFKEKLTPAEIDKVREFCLNLAQESDYAKIKEVMNTMQCIMYFIYESSIDPNSKMTIGAFCAQKFDSKSSLITFANEYKILATTDLSKIVNLDENIEIFWYDYFSKFIPPKFYDKEREPEIEALTKEFFNQVINKGNDLLREFSNALKRFILRHLNERFNPELPLYDYLFLNSFWKSEFREEALVIHQYFPKDVKAKDSMSVANKVRQLIEDKPPLVEPEPMGSSEPAAFPEPGDNGGGDVSLEGFS